jgi:hypothetical protein
MIRQPAIQGASSHNRLLKTRTIDREWMGAGVPSGLQNRCDAQKRWVGSIPTHSRQQIRMEWKQAMQAFRKTVDARLKQDGFLYLNHNQWERPFGYWRGLFAFEINPTNRGQSRRIFLEASIRRTFKMTDADLHEAGERPVASYTTYHVYTIRYPRNGPPEVRIECADDLAAFGQDVIQSLNIDWLPWMIATSQAQGDSVAGVYRQTHRVHRDVVYVP